MNYAAYVGRVGALAVALGVGVAVISTAGTAWAEPDSTDSSADSSASGTNTGDSTHASASNAGGDDPAGGTPAGSGPGEGGSGSTGDSGTSSDEEGSGSTGGMKVGSSGGALTSVLRSRSGAAGRADDSGGRATTTRTSTSQRPTVRFGSQSVSTRGPRTIKPPSSGQDAGTQRVATTDAGAQRVTRAWEGAAPALSMSTASEFTPVPATQWVSRALSLTALSPSASGGVPALPRQSPVQLALLASWRQRSERLAIHEASALAAAVTNSAPVAKPSLGIPNQLTGEVTGNVNATDVDGGPLSYSAQTQPADGTLTVGSTTGAFSYTPSLAARLRAGISTASADFDAFSISVRDAQGAVTSVPVTVPVLPAVWENQPSSSNVTGANPYGVAMVGDLAYVTNQGSNTVSVIDTRTGARVGNPITVGLAPSGIVASPDGKRVYVANRASGTVSVIDTATGKLIDANPATKAVDSIKVGAYPESMALSADGSRLYVANYSSNSVSVINTGTLKLVDANPATITVDAIKVGTNPRGIAFAQTASGPRVYVVNRASGTVSVIDATTNKVVDVNPSTTTVDGIKVGTTPELIAVGRDGQAYVTNYGSNNVSVINTATNQVVGTIALPTQPMGVAVSADGSVAYVTSGRDLVSIIDAKTRTVVATVQIDPVPETNAHTMTVRADGSLVITDMYDRALRVVALVRGNTAPLVQGETVPNEPNLDTGVTTGHINVVDPDGDPLRYGIASAPTSGGTVVFDDNNPGSFTYRPSDAARAAAAQTPGLDYETFVVSVTDGNATVTTTVRVQIVPPPPAGSIPTTTTPIAVGENPIATVTSGNYAYVANYSSNSVTVIDTSNNTVVKTITGVAAPHTMVASPDGSRVFVSNSTSGSTNGNTITVIDTATNTVTSTITVPIGANHGTDLVVSPDGQRLYVLPQANSTMFVVDINRNNASTYGKVIATANVGYHGQFGDAEITPDGSRIYVTADSSGDVLVIDTRTMTRAGTIVFDEYSEGYARKIEISPDGTRAFVLVSHVSEGGVVYNAVSVVDIDPRNTATYNTAIATIGGYQPGYGYAPPWNDIALSPNGGRLYVTSADGMTVTVINTNTRAIIGTFVTDQSSGPYPGDPFVGAIRAVSVAANGVVYVADMHDGKVYAVTVANRPPIIKSVSGDYDPSTGRTTGKVIATDPDGDPLTYTGAGYWTGWTSWGVLSTDATTGDYVYTPDIIRTDGGGGIIEDLKFSVSDGEATTSVYTYVNTFVPEGWVL